MPRPIFGWAQLRGPANDGSRDAPVVRYVGNGVRTGKGGATDRRTRCCAEARAQISIAAGSQRTEPGQSGAVLSTLLCRTAQLLLRQGIERCTGPLPCRAAGHVARGSVAE